jgi:hypothetical protein
MPSFPPHVKPKMRTAFRPKSQARFPGVAAAAKRLGCSKGHLWAVLAGQRVSHRLSRRYAELKANQTNQTNQP